MQIFIAAAPECAQEAAAYGRKMAHVAYRIGENSTLLRRNLLLQTKGGLLAAADRDAPFVEDPEALCRAVLRECGRRNYSGVLLDFEGAPRRDLAAFADALSRALPQRQRVLYVPESYAGGGRTVLINSAVSGGNFTERLREAAARCRGPVALDVQRLRMDFAIPARSGTGAPLSAGELRALMKDQAPSTFFSQELCVRYFSYVRGEEAHFVLYDDAASLSQKVRVAAELGYSAAFFQWPEVCDLASGLFKAR